MNGLTRIKKGQRRREDERIKEATPGVCQHITPKGMTTIEITQQKHRLLQGVKVVFKIGKRKWDSGGKINGTNRVSFMHKDTGSRTVERRGKK